ncbi:Uncharacterized protein TCM_011342 [Theobroma cacao]|uniref:Uncharacterized protein n=1 Tax=Theobroma cacao TaxID=3641 RepID=A0A061EA00_THECC|nr:Uncharacterized protein TCM_011342 [Theobroma cacao]
MTSAWRPCGSGWSFCGRILILVKQFPIFQMQNEYNQTLIQDGFYELTERCTPNFVFGVGVSCPPKWWDMFD